ETFPYPEAWEKKLGEAVLYEEQALEKLNEEYTAYLATQITAFIQKHELRTIDAVCSHGHTIKHEPQNGYTLQIGNLPELSVLIGHTVVCNFRVQDVELGGQGAPLVPIGDELLFHNYEYCLNLGGFANISMNTGGRRIAYDICAVNTVMNALAGKLGKAFDTDGDIAAAGALDPQLLQKLNSLDFYRQDFPKSLGIEWVNEHIFPLIENIDVPVAMHTYAVHAAAQIGNCFDDRSSS